MKFSSNVICVHHLSKSVGLVLLSRITSHVSRIVICLLAIKCAASALGQTAPPSTATSLFKEVIAKYRSAKSYSDDGIFAHGRTSPQQETRSGSFELRFARPFLKFSCQTTFLGLFPLRAVWWSDEHANHRWWSLSNRIETLPADGVYGARWYIGAPAYPLPELLDRRFVVEYFPQISALPPMMIVPDESIDGIECYHLTLKNGAATPGESYDLWIDKNDLLVRKFAYRRGPGWHEEVHRNIQLNVELPDDTLRVAPPES